MKYPIAATAMSCGLFMVLPASGQVVPDQPGDDNTIAEFQQNHPGTGVLMLNEKVSRVYGRAFSHGATAVNSAWSFMLEAGPMLGAQQEDIVAGNRRGNVVQPVSIDPQTGEPKFNAVYFSQQRGGVPVYGSHATVLVRNEANSPAVLAVNNLQDIGDFQPPVDAAEMTARSALQTAQGAYPEHGFQFVLQGPSSYIWPGGDQSRLATRVIVEGGVPNTADHAIWEFVIDSQNGEILLAENTILDVDGSVEGFASPGLFPDQPNNPPELMPLQNATVELDGQTDVTDADGLFNIPGSGQVDSSMTGPFASVNAVQGSDLFIVESVMSGEFAEIIHNQSQTEFDTSQVNGFIHTNVVRDYVASFNPSYPMIDYQMPVDVNVNSSCNATFSPFELDINFYNAAGGCPNTAYSTVVYHEYGHFLINAAETNQGAYGEGMGDSIAVIVTDQPHLAEDFFGQGSGPLRDAVNNQTPCSGPIHQCGRALSGAVWQTRNELTITEPDDYRAIISDITINSILLNPPGIDEGLTVDFLTLDDNNDDIFDGTPHYDEINQGFSEHGMPAPELAALNFTFPDGLPEMLSPSGETFPVLVGSVTGDPEPGTAELLYREGSSGSFNSVALDQIEPNLYDVNFPAVTCGATVEFYFTAETTEGETAFGPTQAPDVTFSRFAAEAIETVFEDNFEQDLGWSVSGNAGDGQWERDVPITDCNRGNPLEDADGSGQAYITDNSSFNQCNSDVDDGQTILTSPALDATVSETPAIAYSRWFSNDQGDSPNQDVFTVEISNDNGQSWTTLETVGPAGPETNGQQWFDVQFAISEFVEPTDQVRVRFIAADTGPGSIVEAGIDAVKINDIICEGGLIGDLNNDGSVNGSDLGILLGNFGSSGQGDLNDDGMIDGSDLGILLGAWTG